MGNTLIKLDLSSLKQQHESLKKNGSDSNKALVKKRAKEIKARFDGRYNNAYKNNEVKRIKGEFDQLYKIIMEKTNTISVPKIEPQTCNGCGRWMSYKNPSEGVPYCEMKGGTKENPWSSSISNQTLESCADLCYYNSNCQSAKLVYPMEKHTMNVNFFADKKEHQINDWTDAWCSNQIKNNIDKSAINGTRSYYGDCPIPTGQNVPANMLLKNKKTGKPLPTDVAVKVAAMPPGKGAMALGNLSGGAIAEKTEGSGLFGFAKR